VEELVGAVTLEAMTGAKVLLVLLLVMVVVGGAVRGAVE
jgi:hypothetical protein